MLERSFNGTFSFLQFFFSFNVRFSKVEGVEMVILKKLVLCHHWTELECLHCILSIFYFFF